MTAGAAAARPEQLSERERQVAERYIRGLSHKDIARALGIAPATVRTHVNAVYRKLEVINRIQLLHRLQKIGPAARLNAVPSADGHTEAAVAPDDDPEPGRANASATSDPPLGSWVKPALAVLPFQNISGDIEQDYFADGIVKDLITALSRFKSFAVVARHSSFVYKDRAVDVRQVARELGVRYVLEGNVRRAGERLRITVQLVDGTSGAHLWADRFDGAVKDIFDLQDLITESVVGIVWPHIREAEIEHSRRKRPESLQAYDLYLQATPYFDAATVKETAVAWGLLSRAIALEPNNGVYLAEAARVLERAVVLSWPPFTEDDRATCDELAHRGLANAQGDASVLATCGIALIQVSCDWNLGLATLRRAVEANPNQFRVMMSAGIGYLKCGDIQDALVCFERAIRLSPANPSAYAALTGIAHAHMVLGNYHEALQAAERSLASSPEYACTYWMLIAANAHLGHMPEAKRWLSKFRTIAPGVTLAHLQAAQLASDSSRMAAIFEGLQLAGLEEE
jgi:TolB-like protein/DNA-binding CsgD family transcriptional regulator